MYILCTVIFSMWWMSIYKYIIARQTLFTTQKHYLLWCPKRCISKTSSWKIWGWNDHAWHLVNGAHMVLQSLSLITEILNWQHALALNALNGNCSWWCSWTETAWGAKYQSLLCYDAVLGGWCNFFNSCFRFCAALSSLLLLCFFTQLSTSWNTCFFYKIVIPGTY